MFVGVLKLLIKFEFEHISYFSLCFNCYIILFQNYLLFKVWSSGTGQTHSPPSDLVMKGSKWVPNKDAMVCVLINSDGEVRKVIKLNSILLFLTVLPEIF